MKIVQIQARQILDSRGNPTVEAQVRLACGARGVCAAPAGASRGSHEVSERRDGGAAFGGMGVTKCVDAIEREIAPALLGAYAHDQEGVDAILAEMLERGGRQRQGGNATIAVSLATARAAAAGLNLPLYRHIGGLAGGRAPVPMFNVLNGGAHAANNLDIQEFMLVPVGADDFAQALRMGAESYHALRALLSERGLSTAVGDEGGFAPDLDDDEQALSLLSEAVTRAGYELGREVALAIDAAAGEWARAEGYFLPKRGRVLSAQELSDFYARLAAQYPLLWIEDPLGEEDFEGFAALRRRLGEGVTLVGDDLFVTDPERIARGVQARSAGAALIKPNQNGTLTGTLAAVRRAREAGMRVIVSHRSGETTDDALADIACAVNAEFLKAGAPARGERVAKYNRVLEIAQRR